jgi:hypothetical protein
MTERSWGSPREHGRGAFPAPCEQGAGIKGLIMPSPKYRAFFIEVTA